MILALLLAAATPQPAPAGQLVPPPYGAGVLADPAQAVALFRDICVAHWRDPEALHYAITIAPVIFAVVPKRDPSRPGENWRSPRLWLSYLPPGAPGTMAAPQCTMHGTVKGGADQLTFAARVAEGLKLRGGTTRTGSGQALTEWILPDPAGAAKVLAMTRNAPGGGTELRLAILPAAQ